MKLNHLNLTVTDVPAAASFLTEYFGLTGEGGNAGMAVLFDDDGLVLTLMKAGRAGADYPSTFHVGFFLASPAAVDALHARLIAGGHEAKAPERNNHAYGFYITAPGGVLVEVGA